MSVPRTLHLEKSVFSQNRGRFTKGFWVSLPAIVSLSAAASENVSSVPYFQDLVLKSADPKPQNGIEL